MNAPAPPGSGWTFAKGLAMAVAVLGMAGFGVCALCGVALSIEDFVGTSRAEIWPLALGLSAVGAAFALGLFFVVRAIVRSTRRPPPAAP
jgi:membrane-bound ClpP family serine protease